MDDVGAALKLGRRRADDVKDRDPFGVGASNTVHLQSEVYSDERRAQVGGKR
jgi:hypothetical protein